MSKSYAGTTTNGVTELTLQEEGGNIGTQTIVWDSTQGTIDQVMGDIEANWKQNGNTLKQLQIGTSCTSIGSGAFFYCTGLTGSLTIANGVTTIESNAFYNCAGFTGPLVIPNSVTSIENGAFGACFGLTGSLTIPDSVATIGSNAFYMGVFFGNTPSWSGTLTIGDGIETIGSSAFMYCSGFTSLTIGNVLTSIGSSCFRQCNDIIDIYINCGSDKWIGSNALSLTTALTKIYINNPDPDAAGYNAAWKTAQGVDVGVVIETWNNFPASTPNP